ncbi:MAG: hypothetical protein JWP37_3277 [Mucilaginibacter sp.]|nr:hypothetical protein [Mucilaginibacter sp.]
MKTQLTLIILLLCFFSCKKQASTNPSAITKQQIANRLKAEEIFPGQKGEIQSGNYYGQTLNYMVINGMKVFEGDVLLTDNAAQSSLIINSTGRPRMSTYLWPGATVYYTINSSVGSTGNTSIVTSAITYWQNNTLIHFVQRTTQPNYVTFIYSLGGPGSNGIGMVGGQQFIYVSGTTGNMIHEIGHTVGLWHEHCRADRDTYVTINYNNMDPSVQINFQTYIQQNQAGYDYTGGLDFGSIMMYDSYQFTINNLPTMTKKDGSTFTAQRNGLSATDIAGVKYMYTPPPIITFNVSSANTTQTTGYSMSDATVNIASGRTVGQNITNTILTSLEPYSATQSPYIQIPTNLNATIIMTIINGYHPAYAFINVGTGGISGVISGNTITFNGVNLSTGPKTAAITLH